MLIFFLFKFELNLIVIGSELFVLGALLASFLQNSLELLTLFFTILLQCPDLLVVLGFEGLNHFVSHQLLFLG